MQEEVSGIRWVKAAALIFLGVAAAWSWLFVVSNWGPAQRIDILTFQAGLTSKVMRTLLQPATGTGHHNHDAANLSGVYATPEYFAMTEQADEAARYLPEKYKVFYLLEDIHVGELPASPPSVQLRVDGGRQFSPADSTVVRDSIHHRTTVVRFANTDEHGAPIVTGRASFFELIAHDPTAHSEQTMRWSLPVSYPQDLVDGNDMSLPTLLALTAGLLAVLSPCLLQLTVYYTFALTGVSMQRSSEDLASSRGSVIRTAVYFIVGFTIVFTLAGALAGMAGQRLQSSAMMENWNRPLGISAGLGILLLGVWTGLHSDRPQVCRLPLFTTPNSQRRWLDRLKMMFMGSAFAIGCSTCFGGALFISLMIYVGSVGSTAVGALALFLFSVGIAVPYLLAAFFLSRALPLLRSLNRASSGVALACGLVLIFFGVILITDNFHIPSNVLYSFYLGL